MYKPWLCAESSNYNKTLSIKIFSNIPIRIKTTLDKFHFIGWTQTQKI